VAEAGDMPKDAARDAIYGEPYAAFKARQPEATQEQIDRMAASVAKNGVGG
jgi:uncharacterized protein